MSADTGFTPYKSEDLSERVKLSEIDHSIRTSGLFFLVSAVVWLLIGTVFAIISSYKMHTPEFLAQYEFLTFGRARSAHLNAMIFGWANNAIFCLGLWVMARLCRNRVRHGGLLLIAGAFWNLGVSIGIFGILTGKMTSVEWLEMPTEVAPVLAFSYVLIGIWGIMAFADRKSEHVYVSQWYILAALFWFPWLYIIAEVMILMVPARGVVQPITNWWFAHNVLGLWLTPVALGVAYYLIPKVLGKPIYSYYLSVIGFWTLALFYNWAGIHHLIGGPIPVWLQTAGIVASVMMTIPVVVVAINQHMTVVGEHDAVWKSPTLRFVVFGAISYTLVSLIGSAMALRVVNEVTHFTHFTVAHAHHGVYAFFTMIMFGGIYFVMPRFMKREWPSATLIRIHFWACALGITLYVVGLSIGGIIQGLELNKLDDEGSIVYPFLQVMANTLPWLASRTVSGILLTIGHFAFAIHFFWMLFAPANKTSEGPTLLAPNNS
ncbi:MAG: cbb3-type cytochrome c oxidase subunit I [Opitutales bacterium]|nr:cbb3-type cytochrome c oxidase subunit I [Opitutales bacterium]